MYKHDGCIWPDYATYKLDAKLNKEVDTYYYYEHEHKRLKHDIAAQIRIVDKHGKQKKEGK